MRKLSVVVLALLAYSASFSQTTPKKTIITRASDHFMIQIAANSWQGAADSVSSYIKGFNRSANAYIMFDKPFKSNPKMSAAIGIGVGTSNIYFNKMVVNITSAKSPLPFVRTDTGSHYKKYKLEEAFLEIPVEFRFMAHPENPNKSIKAAVGFKLGTLLNAHTKGRGLVSASGTKLNDFTVKESSKTFFNTTRLAATARVGYGIFSIFGSYSVTGVFKTGVAPDTKLMQVGLTISGL